jgi:hypothetical protein
VSAAQVLHLSQTPNYLYWHVVAACFLCASVCAAPVEPSLTDLPIDLSFLNASEQPAGKHGFLKTRGSELVFEDGAIGRFWGTNLTAYALFGTPKADVQREAKRLSQLGFNLVRLHHFDSAWVVPNIFGPAESSTSQLNPAMVEKLDWWIKCLGDQGIYIWFDLHVGRQVRATDGIDDFDEIAQGKSSAGLNGYNYVNDSMRQAMKRFDEQLLNHENRFTGRRYRDDPAIAVMLITNENDLTHHYANALLPDKHVPKHTALYLQQADDFAKLHHLARERVWRSWEDGPSKLFLNDLEARFDVDMIEYLRALGAKAPIVTTSSWGLDPLSSLPALTIGDIIDAHSYGGGGELQVNPLEGANLVDWLAAAQVLGKPLTVSEWGVDRDGLIAIDRQDLPLYIAGTASMQGWQAALFYAYAQEPLTAQTGKSSVYQAYNDPALFASLPAAALLYRRRHVAEARSTYVFAVSEERLLSKALSPANSVALRTAVERGKLLIALPSIPQLPWLQASKIPLNAKRLQDPDRSELPASAIEAISDSGELTRNWQQGVFKVNTPQSQAVMGDLCCETITLPQLQVNLQGHHSVVSAQSLDSLPIKASRLIMISITAGAVPTSGEPTPYKVEHVVGRIRVGARAGMQLLEWNAIGSKFEPRAVPYKNGQYLITIGQERTSPWLFLRASSNVMQRTL